MSIFNAHPNLTTYVEAKNRWDRIMKRKARYDLSRLTRADKRRLFDDIESELSPENLTCDGELSGEGLRQRFAYLQAVKRELETIQCV